jgi:DNA processing protein
MSINSDVSDVAVAAPNPASFQATYWLALALTPGLGPTRIKKLIEHYGTAELVFHASLTELEAMGMRAVSAQSLATGKNSRSRNARRRWKRARELFRSAIPNIRHD